MPEEARLSLIDSQVFELLLKCFEGSNIQLRLSCIRAVSALSITGQIFSKFDVVSSRSLTKSYYLDVFRSKLMENGALSRLILMASDPAPVIIEQALESIARLATYGMVFHTVPIVENHHLI